MVFAAIKLFRVDMGKHKAAENIKQIDSHIPVIEYRSCATVLEMEKHHPSCSNSTEPRQSRNYSNRIGMIGGQKEAHNKCPHSNCATVTITPAIFHDNDCDE